MNFPLPTQEMLDDIAYDPRDGSNMYTRAIDKVLGDMLDLKAFERDRAEQVDSLTLAKSDVEALPKAACPGVEQLWNAPLYASEWMPRRMGAVVTVCHCNALTKMEAMHANKHLRILDWGTDEEKAEDGAKFDVGLIEPKSDAS